MTLKPGSKVYRVVEDDPPPNRRGPHSWTLASSEVIHVSAKQIKLKTYMSGLWNTTFKPDALGRSFFETPRQAVQHFLAVQKEEVKSLDRQRKDALRAIEWAKGQDKVNP